MRDGDLSPTGGDCYGETSSGGILVWSMNTLLLRSVMIGALAAATVLAGCGRKGPLEPPPSAQAPAPASRTDGRRTDEPRPVMNNAGYPVAPPGEKKRIPLDWLID
jgi:predicted small lipoprotein YifL